MFCTSNTSPFGSVTLSVFISLVWPVTNHLGWCSSGSSNSEKRGFFPPHRSQVHFCILIPSGCCHVAEFSPPEPKPISYASFRPSGAGLVWLLLSLDSLSLVRNSSGHALLDAHPWVFTIPPGVGGKVSNALKMIGVIR